VAGIFAVLNHQAKLAMIWLVVAQVIDGIDGPIARRIQISRVLPQVDGYVMDLIVDYLTCVVVPAIFLHEFDMLPPSLSVPVMGVVLFSSALWFSRADLITEDHWFYGFPAVWNLVVPTLYLLHTSVGVNLVVVVVFCALQMTKIEIAHPVQVIEHRRVAIPITVVWLLTMVIAIIGVNEDGTGVPVWEKAILVLAPAYFAAITVMRARNRRLIPASTPV
jgi:phosphatidylcholine synthase